MANKAFRMDVGAIFTKGPGKIYFYRYQIDGNRKIVRLKTANRPEAIKTGSKNPGADKFRRRLTPGAKSPPPILRAGSGESDGRSFAASFLPPKKVPKKNPRRLKKTILQVSLARCGSHSENK